MNVLLLKLVLTPILIGAVSLAARRWGPAVSGWLVGLPLTSGPVALFLALGQGPAFAARASVGILAGTVSAGAFCLVYGWLAFALDWRLALPASWLAFLALTFGLQLVHLPALVVFGVVVAALALILLMLARLPRVPNTALQESLIASADLSPLEFPYAGTSVPRVRPAKPYDTHAVSVAPGWDIPARMLVATVFVLLLTASASALGPQLSGLLAPFPIYTSILAVFTHRLDGSAAVAQLLRGVTLGLVAFSAFFLIVALLLVPAGIALAFVAASVVGLGIQGTTLWLLRRARRLPVAPGVAPEVASAEGATATD